MAAKGQRMRTLVYGAGAMGLYFAARLAQAGHQVTIKGRSTTVDALAGQPVRLVRGSEVTEVRGIYVVDTLQAAQFDLIVVTTKAWQLSGAAADIATVTSPTTRVVSTQNGVDAMVKLGEHLPVESVLAGTAVVIVERHDACLVELLSAEASVTLGSLIRFKPDAADRAVLDALSGAGITTAWTSNIQHALWKKLALIASYGGVGALSGASVGQTRAIPETRALVEDAMREVFAVGNAQGADLNQDDLADILETYEHRFAASTTASMQRDLAAGIPSELADQIGAVIAHAATAGVNVPIHRTIYASQLPREREARGLL